MFVGPCNNSSIIYTPSFHCSNATTRKHRNMKCHHVSLRKVGLTSAWILNELRDFLPDLVSLSSFSQVLGQDDPLPLDVRGFFFFFSQIKPWLRVSYLVFPPPSSPRRLMEWGTPTASCCCCCYNLPETFNSLSLPPQSLLSRFSPTQHILRRGAVAALCAAAHNKHTLWLLLYKHR